jgi:hypothetical protein
MEITEAMIEAGAEALVQQQTNGLCHLGKVCEFCDCVLAFHPEDPHRDGYAREHARAVLEAALAGDS